MVSDIDKIALKPFFDDETKTISIGNIHIIDKNKKFPKYDERKNLIFVGGFEHKPNIDCVKYLNSDIMPLLWKSHPEISISIIGSNVPLEIEKLNTAHFKIIGFVENLDSCFDSARVFVAPLRYGAGIKGKIGQSLELKLPFVTTGIGAEGFDFFENHDFMVANETESIVAKIIAIYDNEIIWNKISSNAHRTIEPFSEISIEQKVLSLIK